MMITPCLRVILFSLIFLTPLRSQADTEVFVDSGDYSSSPTQGSTSSPPLVMFAISFDHELFKKAYSDYSDIDGDGVMDITYSDTIDYYGYFESDWCYAYISNRFKPMSKGTGTNGHRCGDASAPWSGNFMNWATMSRIDLIRKVLYGGKRSTDSKSLTILERAEIPFDFHAWGKVYNGSDIADYTPYSSSGITLCNLSESASGSPLVRIRTSADRNWAGLSRTRCQGSAVADYNVRIEACHSNSTSENCQAYGSERKPVGLMQKYQNVVEFGLITGSYEKNISGGVLRKNISSATDEVDPSTGQFINNSGMVNTLDKLRVSEYSYNSARYNCSGSWPVTCRDWGNPMSEIYAEALRYIAGRSGGSSQYSVGNDLGLPKPAWVDPYSAENRCANCAIVILSTGQNSYDGDNFGSIGDVLSSGTSQLNQLTNNVGNLEPDLSFPGSFIIGSNGGSDILQCEPKNLPGLSNARGICPEIPEYQGSYYAAGLAHYARTNDLRNSLDGKQTVTTYAVEIAQTVPSLAFGVPDGSGNRNLVSVTPICQTIDFSRGFNENHYRPCRYLDQRIDNFTLDSEGLLNSITFRTGWADESFGGDGDTDSEATYTITTSQNNLRVRIFNPAFNGANSFRYGYSISGVQGHNGMVLDADYNSSYNSTSRTNAGFDDGDSESALLIRTCFRRTWSNSSCLGDNGTSVTPTDVTKNFTPANNTANTLPKPLLLAAKYGGFTDLDNDGTPYHDANGDGTPEINDTREWDNRNNLTGTLGADGIPDNYFFPNNPSLLESQLGQILKDIASRISAGSGAALVSNSTSGVGSAIQALFRPKVTINDIEINWVGLMHSLFIDPNGHLREDSNGNATLDDYTVDKAVTLFYNPGSNQTVIQRYTSDDNGKTLIPEGNTVDLTELKPVWDARERLMEISNNKILTQRNYSSPSNNGRYILTWIDLNDDLKVYGFYEIMPFEYDKFRGREGYLGVPASETEKLIKYIRGADQPGYRSRSIDYDNDGDLETWRLGDIIHSSPVSVAAPKGFYSENRSFNSNDNTFIEFQNMYKDRRQMIYVGGNDGMIHAINGGFWNNDKKKFTLSNGNGETSHPLGGEVWAYVPMNLLPHLRWLSEPDYPHVYYMDGSPLIFDANIFPFDDGIHPNGWGTVMVMGMRLGGGPIDASVGSTTKTMRSAYVVMDITDPEQPPSVIAEITHPELGFTTAQPVVIQRRSPNSDGTFDLLSKNDWYLAFGSGPIGASESGTRDALNNATSDQSMKVFIYDLIKHDFLTGFDPYDSSHDNSYAGAMSVVDWNNDFYDDAIYFGTVQTSTPLSGKLMRINLEDPKPENWSLDILTDPGRPITAAPTTVVNTDNERWIFAGTGRELIRSDSRSAAQEYFFGVKEPSSGNKFTYNPVDFSSLVDTTDIQVQADGNFASSLSIRPGTSVSSFEGLLNAMKSETGWVNRLEYDGTSPAGKSLSPAVNTFALLLLTEYVPPADQCLIDGLSYLLAPHYQTGTAIPAGTQSVLTTGTIDSTTISTKRISLGAGLAPAPALYQGVDGKTSVIIQGGAGNISSTNLEYKLSDDGRQTWRQIFDIPR